MNPAQHAKAAGVVLGLLAGAVLCGMNYHHPQVVASAGVKYQQCSRCGTVV